MPKQDNTQQEAAPDEELTLEQIEDAAFEEFAAIADEIEPDDSPASIDDAVTETDEQDESSAESDDDAEERSDEDAAGGGDTADSEGGEGTADASEDSDERSDADDIWAGATEAARKQFEEQQALLEQLKHADRSNRGRVSALQKKLDEVARKRVVGPAEDDDTTNAGQSAAELSDSEMTELEKDFPEVAKALRIQQARIQQLTGQVESKFSAVQDQLSPLQAERESAFASAEQQRLIELHPEAQDMMKNPEHDFWYWLANQSPTVQAIGADESAEASATLITLYKANRQSTSADAAGESEDNAEAEAAAAQEAERKAEQERKRKQRLEDMKGLPNAGSGKQARTEAELDEDAAWDKFSKAADANIA